MAIFDQIKQTAIEIAESLEARVAHLNRELADIDGQRAKKKAERDMASGAYQRLLNFPVKLGSDYLCPKCWVTEGKRSPLSPIPSDSRNDLFRCNLCHFNLTIEN